MENNYSLDLPNLPKELRLILEILRNETEDCLREFNKHFFTDIDWEFFLHLSLHHRVYPLVYLKIIKLNGNSIPAYVIQTLYKEYKQNTFRMLQLSGEMEQVSKLFNENEVPLLFLKGPVIAHDIYGDISLRTSKDLDILIPKVELAKTEKLLMSFGYEKMSAPTAFNEWKWDNHHFSYFHPQKRIQIEIHWRLHPRPSKEPNFNELWKRKRMSMLTNYPVHFLGNDDLFSYLIAHGARHGWFRLRWLADIDQIVRKNINLNKNNRLQRQCLHQHLGGQEHLLVGQALILASQLFNTPINDEMQKLTEEKRFKKVAKMGVFYINEMSLLDYSISEDVCVNNDKHSLKSNLQKSFYVHLYLFSLKTNLQKFLFFIKLFYPSSADTKTLKLPKPLQFLYFPLHPFLWAWRKTRKPL
ncbi:nucleotidyltransferase domain-containing protein [Peribacillus butanolivorans]|uniref:nucleotidyltransferase domain-containing protein n=1 Tax=Peribacillus butanolivorans TaxID=421767 RepID=UPI0037F9EC85